MTGFELWSSGDGNDHSVNRTTTQALQIKLSKCHFMQAKIEAFWLVFAANCTNSP